MSRHKRGGHEVGGRALHPRGPPVAPPTYSFLLYIPTYPQTIRYGAKNLIPPRQLSISTRSHLGACSGAPPKGASITKGFYINTIAPPMSCDQFYHRRSGPQLLAIWLLLSFWISIQCSPPLLWRFIPCNLLFAVCLLRRMNCGFMIKSIYEQYLNLL